MSAFAVLWNTDGSAVADAKLARLEDLVRHRAFDGTQARRLGDVAVVHARLVTDRQSERDEGIVTDPSTGVTVVCAARLDDRASVDRTLGIGLGPTPTDTRRMLDWYLAGRPWGDVIGDFAAVVWHPGRRRLVAIRDQLGVRPLYYGRVGASILVASEIRAFGALPGAFAELDEMGLADQMQRESELPEHTVYRAIRRVSAASFVELTENATVTRRYWELDVSRRTKATFEELTVETRRLVDQAIRCRLGTGRPVAVEVSGGLDSSAVVGAAQLLVRAEPDLADRLVAVSLIHPGLACDESDYIRAVVDRAGVEWHGFDGTEPVDADYVRREAAFTGDIPVYTHLAGHQRMRRCIRESGAATVLTGQGGDTLFDSMPAYLSDLLRSGHLATLARHLRARRAVGWGPMLPDVLRNVVRPLLPAAIEHLVTRARGSRRPPWIPDDLHIRWQQQVASETPRWAIAPVHRAALNRRDLVTPASLGAHFETMDRLGGRIGVEYRHPLFDRRLLEFIAGVDECVHTDGTTSRRLQRAAFADVYPDVVARRDTKAEFSATVQIATEAHAAGAYELPVLQAAGLVIADELVARFLQNHAVLEGTRLHGVATHAVGSGLMGERLVAWWSGNSDARDLLDHAEFDS